MSSLREAAHEPRRKEAWRRFSRMPVPAGIDASMVWLLITLALLPVAFVLWYLGRSGTQDPPLSHPDPGLWRSTTFLESKTREAFATDPARAGETQARSAPAAAAGPSIREAVKQANAESSGGPRSAVEATTVPTRPVTVEVRNEPALSQGPEVQVARTGPREWPVARDRPPAAREHRAKADVVRAEPRTHRAASTHKAARSRPVEAPALASAQLRSNEVRTRPGRRSSLAVATQVVAPGRCDRYNPYGEAVCLGPGPRAARAGSTGGRTAALASAGRAARAVNSKASSSGNLIWLLAGGDGAGGGSGNGASGPGAGAGGSGGGGGGPGGPGR